MPPKTKTLTLSEEMRETDQLNVWCKVCGELVAEVKVVHANKPTGFNPTRRQQMLVKVSKKLDEWDHDMSRRIRDDEAIGAGERDLVLLGRVQGAQFVMRTIQGLFRDFELDKHPGLLKG